MTASIHVNPQPLIAQLDLTYEDTPDGGFAAVMPLTPYVLNPRGSLLGGLIGTLVDVVAGKIAVSGLPEGMSMATADMNLHYLSAMRTGPVRAVGKVIRRGSRSVVVQVEVSDDAADDIGAIGIVSFTVVRIRQEHAGTVADDS